MAMGIVGGMAVTVVAGAIGNRRAEKESGPRQWPQEPTVHITMHLPHRKIPGAGMGADTGIS